MLSVLFMKFFCFVLFLIVLCFHFVSSNRYIVFDDLLRFLSEDEALQVMQLFEVPSEEETRISSRVFVDWVV